MPLKKGTNKKTIRKKVKSDLQQGKLQKQTDSALNKRRKSGVKIQKKR